MSYSIFLSHGTVDSAIAEVFKNKIEELNIGAYLYEYDRQPGTYIAGKLQKVIDNVDVLLVLLTKQSQHSPYLHQEIGYAEGKGKLVIPLVEPGTDRNVLGMLEGREYIPYEHESADEAMTRVQTYLGHKKWEKDTQEALIVAGIILVAILFLMAASEN